MSEGRVPGWRSATVAPIAALLVGAVVLGVLARGASEPATGSSSPTTAASEAPSGHSQAPASGALAGAVTPGCMSQSMGPRASETPPRPSIDTTAGRPGQTVVILGDSYSSGWRGVGEGAAGWPAILGAIRDWDVHDLAVPGTGYLNPGFTQPIGSRVAAAVLLKPGVVFVVGGHNDEELATTEVAAAADRVLDRLASGLPLAVLVVVGPIWPEGDQYGPALVPLRDHLRAKATAMGALFIDPIGDRWFLGSNGRFIGPDGTHPTAEGYRRIAELIGAALQADPRLAAGHVGGSATPVETGGPPMGPQRVEPLPACAS